MPDFNRLASNYDSLKRLVFGNEIGKATKFFLEDIPNGSEILVVGGGTGEILKDFNSTHQITYLEASEAMISKAEKVDSIAAVNFIHDDVLTWLPNEKFDIVITPFLLDCFTESQLELIFSKFRENLSLKGQWIQTDFYPKTRPQKWLVKLMYLFFNVMVDLKTNRLADFDMLFEKYDFECELKASFFHSMIESKIYRKIE